MEPEGFAVAAPGLEEIVADELSALGLPDVRRAAGGVRFGGGLLSGMRACLGARVATTVRLVLARFSARDARALARGLAAVPWADWLPADRPIPLKTSSRRSRLYHGGLLEEAVARAAGDPFHFEPGSGGVLLRLDRDGAEVGVDLAGERLHQRGWRKEGGPAPLRETLAAGLLRLAGWRPEIPLVDPMCGSGTLVIEAALSATGRAPGLGRHFAFETFPCFDAAAWRRMVDEASAGIRPAAPAPIHGSDAHRGAVASATRNAERAGVSFAVRLERLDVAEVVPPQGEPGVLVTNPPYGARIGGDRRAVAEAHAHLGHAIAERFAGWRCFVLTPDRRLAEATGLVPDAGIPLRNGGLKVRLHRLTA